MRMVERVEIVQRHLELRFPNPQIPLTHTSPFTLLVAVVLSAQCTDARVNLVTPALFAEGGDPWQLRALGARRIEELIKTCGLAKTKAAHIYTLCGQLIDRHDGEVPACLEALKALAGVGHKTASVVMCQAFGIPAFPVDTHILRCAQRWGLSKHRGVEGVEKDLKRRFQKKRWALRHLQIIYYARAFCPALGHQTNACPICRELYAES